MATYTVHMQIGNNYSGVTYQAVSEEDARDQAEKEHSCLDAGDVYWHIRYITK